MGIFDKVGSIFKSPIGSAADVGLGFISGSREKRGIEVEVRAEQQQTQEILNQAELLRERTLGRTGSLVTAGQESTSRLQDLLFGGARLEPTAGETFAKEQALEGIDRASAAGKRLFSGRRLEDVGEATAAIGSRFRQQDISNLQNLQGQGLQATGLAQRGDFNISAEQNRLRELLGNVSSAGILGKTGVDTANIGNISSNLGKLLTMKQPPQGATT